MLKLNIKNGIISFKDIQPNQLSEILKWYNNHKDFKYATGVDKPITMKCLMQKYEEVAICSSEFFTGIYENRSCKMIGILKGRIKDRKSNILWINSLAIASESQRNGYGSLAINLLLAHMKELYNIKIVYISVVEDNIQGLNFWKKANFTSAKRIENNFEMDGVKHSTIILQKTT